jgi:putative component of membrane protein insertase Oxa1/YidC/SpoIIIJ protein YidD
MNFKLLILLPLFVFASPGFYEPWGKDAGLKQTAKVEKKQDSIPIQIANAVIRFHQEVISPVDGPRSHYRPSSSQYMQQAMRRYGFLKGYMMGCDRLLRENDEEWVYRKVEYNGRILKYDPAELNKY